MDLQTSSEFALVYTVDGCPYKVGDEVKSPVIDGHETTVEFIGYARVVSIARTWLYDEAWETMATVVHYYEPPWGMMP